MGYPGQNNMLEVWEKQDMDFEIHFSSQRLPKYYSHAEIFCLQRNLFT